MQSSDSQSDFALSAAGGLNSPTAADVAITVQDANQFQPASKCAEPTVYYVVMGGCGWMHMPYYGFGKFMQEHMDCSSQYLRFGGTSAGSVLAAGLATGIPMDAMLENCLQSYESIKTKPWLMPDYCKKMLQELAPEDSVWASLATGRLLVGVTHFQLRGLWLSCTSKQITEFDSREHAIDVLRASCHLPLIAGVKPYTVKGVGYYDGGVADLVPIPKDPTFLEVKSEDGHPLPVKLVRVDACGDPGEWEASIGFVIPRWYNYYPRPLHILAEFRRIGYLMAAEFWSSQPWESVQHVWKGPRLTEQQLQAYADEKEELLQGIRDLIAGRRSLSVTSDDLDEEDLAILVDTDLEVNMQDMSSSDACSCTTTEQTSRSDSSVKDTGSEAGSAAGSNRSPSKRLRKVGSSKYKRASCAGGLCDPSSQSSPLRLLKLAVTQPGMLLQLISRLWERNVSKLFKQSRR